MQLLNHNGNEFCVAHFQGKCQSQYPQVVNEINRQEIVMPENVETVTVSNHPELSILVEQLNKFNIPFINKVPLGGYWINSKKISYIIEGLYEVKSKYVLILDADDVLLTKDIIHIVDKIGLFDKKMIFGATKNNHPDIVVDKIHDRDFRGNFRYLNAGTCFGLVDDCLKFYLQAKHVLENILIYNPLKSEQLIIRETFKNATEYVDFDYQCNLFQTFDSTYAWKAREDSYMVI